MDDVLFTDRTEAGKKLAEKLQPFQDASPVIFPLLRGGLPIGYEIARALHAPLHIMLVRKIGAPWNPELAIGAVVDGDVPELVLNDALIQELEVTDPYIEREKAKQLAEIVRRRLTYRLGEPVLNLEGHTAIVVDDGIATGATMRAVLHALRHKCPKQLVAAVPVAPITTAEKLIGEADEVICLHTPLHFFALGSFYRDFPQLTDADVLHILEKIKHLDAENGAPKETHVSQPQPQ